MNPYDFDTRPPEPKRRNKRTWTGSELKMLDDYEDVAPLPAGNPDDETTQGDWLKP